MRMARWSVLDNTWATPLYFRAFDHGVDVSVHAATKYIGGHSDVLLGADRRERGDVSEAASACGPTWASPRRPTIASSACAACARWPCGSRASRRARWSIAHWLQEQPEVKEVIYPALPGARGHELWKRDFQRRQRRSSASSCSRWRRSASRRCSTACVCSAMGWSWGGFESLVIPTCPERTRTRHALGRRRPLPAPCDRPRGPGRPDRRSGRMDFADGLSDWVRNAASCALRNSCALTFAEVDAPARAASARTSAGGPAAMMRPWSSTMTRSAKANTTSMSCSVKSTAIRSCAREIGRRVPSARPRERGDMPAVGSSISSSRGCAGERQRELDALGVAVGERGAVRVGEVGASDALEQRVGRRRARRRSERRHVVTCAPGVRKQRDRDVLAHRHRREGRGDLERAAHAQARDRVRGQAVDARRRASVTVPASGASWPLTRLKQVVLPAPLGPISATSSPAATVNDTSRPRRRRRTPCVRPSTASTALPWRAAHRRDRRAQRSRRAADAHREHEHERPGSARPAPRASSRCCARSASGSQVNAAAPSSGPSERIQAAQQHHHQRVDRARNRQRLRRDAALGERVQPAGEARRTCRRARMPLHCVRTHVDAERPGAQRRIAPAAQRVAEGRPRDRTQRRERRATTTPSANAVVRALVGEPPGGHTPTRPFEPPVTASHWNAIDHTICAKASVSIAR